MEVLKRSKISDFKEPRMIIHRITECWLEKALRQVTLWKNFESRFSKEEGRQMSIPGRWDGTCGSVCRCKKAKPATTSVGTRGSPGLWSLVRRSGAVISEWNARF